MEIVNELCPLCTEKNPTGAQYDIWLQCDACSIWYHADCLKIPAVDCDTIEIFHCPSCLPIHGPSTCKYDIMFLSLSFFLSLSLFFFSFTIYNLKPQPRKSKRDSIRLNYADMNEGLAGDEKIWGKMLNTKTFDMDRFKRYKGDQVTLERFRKHGLKEPFVIECDQDLGMKMPSNETTVQDIAKAVGEDRPVEVIDVATQSDSPGWTMGKWAEYYNNPDRDRIRNVISLEISGTEFGSSIIRPKLVRDMDWIDHMWPKDLRPKEYPKVQLYCLMGTKDSYTDFHIDFGGSSVFYHIIRGSKIFYFIEPTSKNLKRYQKWSSSPEQSSTFLGDEVKSCYAVHLKAGNTMIIPTGWIHAVYTPEDALVIGGNFLHGLNIGTQLQIYDIEEATNVPAKFRFPYFKRINWYAAQKYNSILQDDSSSLSIFELQGIMDLAQWLRKDVELLEKDTTSSQERKNTRADIPSSIEDPSDLIFNLIQGSSTATLQQPKLVLKLKQPSNRGHVSDDEFVVDEEEELLGFGEEDYLVDDSDDFEYQEEDDEFHPDDGTKSISRRTTTTKRSRKRTTSNNASNNVNSDSSSDDDMGTSKRTAGSSSVRRHPLTKRARTPSAPSTVKQRLLDRFVRR
ncbi:uncharacterized protein BX664DRAFT_290676 [Halteromyces radiatus]|uniref:uncharacterized protein n=1 Tax=Halteromyces radiatus TaxID=101107 RepID=UPI00221EBA97|nr:uncharacterized protein BX664DRAFT_290676 [Halteromyces radiatus]KAI8100122.1 hypothetical protein BX664DRAFT_290676 [Halteromyces radiatus]